ncbi:MAG: hypothetical protein KGN35_08390 [Betaproteobacteria bacterium]|nr:hypothetical protein [Betaproteobacteria bacterium]
MLGEYVVRRSYETQLFVRGDAHRNSTLDIYVMRKHLANSFLLFVCLIVSVTSESKDKNIWHDKGFNGPPMVIYSLRSTCGDFLRASENSAEHSWHVVWVMGFISGINRSLPNGGNSLGGGVKKIEDFMILVKKYCEENPTDDFVKAVSNRLDKMESVDWEGQLIKK